MVGRGGVENGRPKASFSAEAFVPARRYRKLSETPEDFKSEEDCRRLEIKEKFGEVTLLSVIFRVVCLFTVTFIGVSLF